MRTLALALAVLAVAPATALAEPFGELPYRSFSGAAGCVRPAGAPSVLARTADDTAQFIQAGPTGFQDMAKVGLNDIVLPCSEAAVTASGAGVVAAREFGSGNPAFQLVAAVRDPGGTFGKLQVLGGGDLPTSSLLAVASERGDAAVAWTQSADLFSGPYRLRLARRAPGGAFAKPVTVFSTTGDDPAPGVRMAFAASGELVAAWTRRDPATKALVAEAAIAPAGGTFGPPQRIGPARAGSAPALAVAPDGSALVAYAAGTELRVAERPPGGAFGAPVKVATADDALAVVPAAALGPDGAAAVAWESVLQQGVGLVTRARAGAFGTPVTLQRNRTLPPGVADQVAAILEGLGGAGDLSGALIGGGTQVALTGDRALVTLIRQRRPDGVRTRGLRVDTMPLAGGHLETQTLGGTLRDVFSTAPVVLPDGRAGVAWADEGPDDSQGRLHLALAGAPAAVAPAAPVVRLGQPRQRVLDAEDPLRVPVTCSAACDVRLQRVGRADSEALLSLSQAGTRTLKVDPAGGPIAHLRRGPIRFRLAAGPPNGPARVRTVSFTLRRRPVPPAPRVSGLTAVRHGAKVVVSWQTDRRVAGVHFVVATTRRRSEQGVPVALGTPLSTGRTFSLELSSSRRARWAYVQYVSGSTPGKPMFTRISG